TSLTQRVRTHGKPSPSQAAGSSFHARIAPARLEARLLLHSCLPQDRRLQEIGRPPFAGEYQTAHHASVRDDQRTSQCALCRCRVGQFPPRPVASTTGRCPTTSRDPSSTATCIGVISSTRRRTAYRLNHGLPSCGLLQFPLRQPLFSPSMSGRF